MTNMRGALLVAALLGLTAPEGAGAATLLLNGDFEQTNFSGSHEFGTRATQNGTTYTVAGWTTSGFNWLFASGEADTKGGGGEFGTLKLWGPGTGVNNGLPASSPAGGSYVAADGAYGQDAIRQVVSGLVPGQAYTVSFWWAGAQQSGYNGATTEQWRVSLGNDAKYTAVAQNVNHGFTGWMRQSMTFVATSATETLAFFAIGTPTGVPPFSLLDGVSMELAAVPEPASVFGVGLLGLAGLGMLRRSRRRDATAAA